MTTYLPSITIPATVFEQPAASILLPLVLGNVVGYGSRPNRTKQRYRELEQPPGNPPPYVFGPVWTALYAAMGYAAHRAWKTGSNSFNPDIVALTKQGATLYTIQLGLNLLWMPTFFGLERPIEATADIVALLGTTSYLTYIWSKVDQGAAWTMVPYLAWQSFALYLCVSVPSLKLHAGPC